MERLGVWMKRQAVAEPFVAMGTSEKEKLHVAAVNALLARANIASRRELQGNPYASFSLLDLAHDCCERAGINVVGLTAIGVFAAAITTSTSDFPGLLANVLHKTLLRGFDAAGETYSQWTVPGVLADFKPSARVGLGTFPALDRVIENTEYKTGHLADRKETATLATYGKIYSVSRTAMINDDLGALIRVPLAAGRAAARTVGDLAYGVLTGNPTMGDGIALFHASHANLITGAAITTESVDAMRAAMAAQTENGVTTGIRVDTLLVPMALEGTARAVANSQFFVGDAGLDARRVNSAFATFDIVADWRLDIASAAAWYAVADPEQFDTVELAYLNGDPAPRLEMQKGFSPEGVSFKVSIDCAATPLEYRALAANPGP